MKASEMFLDIPESRTIDAIIQQESGGNNKAVSSKGAQGMAQIMPRTAKNPGYGVNPLRDNSPEEQRRFATDYYGALFKKYKGDESLALAAYNAGPGAVDAHKGIPPYPETQHYVKNILSALNPISDANASEEPYQEPVQKMKASEMFLDIPEQKQPVYPGQSSYQKNVKPDSLADMYLNADTETGAPAGLRAQAGLKASQAGMENFLREKLGAENVTKIAGDRTMIKQNGKWTQFDENGLTLRDLADLSGDAIETAPSIAAGIVSGGNPLAVAGGQAAGSSMRHGLSALMPGSDEMSLGERAGDVATKSLLSGGMQLGTNKLFDLADKINPKNLIAKNIRAGMVTPYGKEGLKLNRDFGGTLSPGQISGSNSTLTMEGLARRNPASADIVQDFDNKAIQSGYNKLLSVADKVDPSATSQTAMGQGVTDAFHNISSKLVKQRAVQADADFSELDSVTGNAPIFGLQNTVNRIDQLVKDMHTPVGSDTANKTLEGLMKLRKQITGNDANPFGPGTSLSTEPAKAPLTLNGKQFQRTLEIWGKAARGTGNILEDLGDKATNRMINKRLFGALQEDLNVVAEIPGASGDVAQALQNARSNYKLNSESIDAHKNSLLGKLFKGDVDPDPTRLASKFLTMNHTEAKAAIDIIESHDPVAAGAIKRNMLQDIIDKASPEKVLARSGQQGAALVDDVNNAFSPSKFITGFTKKHEVLKSVLGKDDYNDVLKTVSYLRRVADRAGTDGSPTAPLNMAWDVAKGIISFNPVTMGKTAAGILAPRKIAQLMTTPEGRRALQTMSKTDSSTKARTAAALSASRLLAFDARE